MGLSRMFCTFLVLAVLAEVVIGQEYVGRGERERERSRGRRCPPRCSLVCTYGFQRDSRGCELCSCNPGHGSVGIFPQPGHGSVHVLPQTHLTQCPPGSVPDVSYPTCQSSQWGSLSAQLGGQCRQGYFCSQGGRCCGYVSALGGVHRTSGLHGTSGIHRTIGLHGTSGIHRTSGVHSGIHRTSGIHSGIHGDSGVHRPHGGRIVRRRFRD